MVDIIGIDVKVIVALLWEAAVDFVSSWMMFTQIMKQAEGSAGCNDPKPDTEWLLALQYSFYPANGHLLQSCQSRASTKQSYRRCFRHHNTEALLLCITSNYASVNIRVLLSGCCCIALTMCFFAVVWNPKVVKQNFSKPWQTRGSFSARYAVPFSSFFFILPSCVPVHHPLWCSADRRNVLIPPLCRPEAFSEWGLIIIK